jgi:hypothetical protein
MSTANPLPRYDTHLATNKTVENVTQAARKKAERYRDIGNVMAHPVARNIFELLGGFAFTILSSAGNLRGQEDGIAFTLRTSEHFPVNGDIDYVSITCDHQGRCTLIGYIEEDKLHSTGDGVVERLEDIKITDILSAFCQLTGLQADAGMLPHA